MVTGSLQPIGTAIIEELATHGAACIFACSSATTPIAAHESLIAALLNSHPNTKVVPYPLDTSSEADTLALIDDILNACGRLDVWVCSSGLLGPPSIEDLGPGELNKCWENNALAPFFALKYARRAMEKKCAKGNYPNAAPKDAAYGSIIIVGSVASESGGMLPNHSRKMHVHSIVGLLLVCKRKI